MIGRPHEYKSFSCPNRASSVSELTQLLEAVNAGVRAAIDRLIALMYESYLRFLSAGRLRVKDLAHFMLFMAEVNAGLAQTANAASWR